MDKQEAHALEGKAVNTIGERAIIELMRGLFEPMPDIIVPFGDDVSALPIGEGDIAVLKTDMLVGATDVPRGMSFWQAGRKAVTMNVSDFAAKGVQPKAILVSLGVPASLSSKDIVELAKGLNSAAVDYGTHVIGGDTGEACDLIVAIQVYGTSNKGEIMLRSGVKVDDLLAVTGLFGKTAAGLRLLLDRNCKVSRDFRDVLIDSVYMPHARLHEGLALRRSVAVSASIDSSDGLAWCLNELSVQNDVGFLVSDLPIAEEAAQFAEMNGFDAAELALYGGEEYELVVTVHPHLWHDAETAVKSVGGNLIPIGKAIAEKRLILNINGKEQLIEARGYEHFKPEHLKP